MIDKDEILKEGMNKAYDLAIKAINAIIGTHLQLDKQERGVAVLCMKRIEQLKKHCNGERHDI